MSRAKVKYEYKRSKTVTQQTITFRNLQALSQKEVNIASYCRQVDNGFKA